MRGEASEQLPPAAGDWGRGWRRPGRGPGTPAQGMGSPGPLGTQLRLRTPGSLQEATLVAWDK